MNNKSKQHIPLESCSQISCEVLSLSKCTAGTSKKVLWSTVWSSKRLPVPRRNCLWQKLCVGMYVTSKSRSNSCEMFMLNLGHLLRDCYEITIKYYFSYRRIAGIPASEFIKVLLWSKIDFYFFPINQKYSCLILTTLSFKSLCPRGVW